MSRITEIWIDALDFQERGGWKQDTQYVHLMGGGYLIAADDPGVPVADAVVKVEIPEKANYRIWVRDRNWFRQYSPGKFKLLVDGEATFNTMGAIPSDAWVWEVAGDFVLEPGEHTIALHDLTGYFGRCASILITNDFDYVPPREVDRLQRERARIKGLSTGIEEGGAYDVIVAGGGVAGVPAALASARLGCKVLMIHNRSVLGGNASSEIGIPCYGAEVGHPQAREGGIAEEIMRMREREIEKVGEWTRPMEQLVAAEKNITVVYNTNVSDAEMDGNRIRSVITQNIVTLCKTRYSAKYYIDCTGDGWLGYYAGAKYRYGREAKYEYNEGYADEHADTITMSGCVRAGDRPFFIDTGAETEFILPEWCPKLPEDEENFGHWIEGPKPHWWMEIPNEWDDIYDGEEARDALLMVLMSSWDHMKHHWAKKETMKNYKLNIAGIINGRRESRRLIGDYILTQNDCFESRKFDDVIAHAGWPLDVHHPKGVFSGKDGDVQCFMHVPLVDVPYRILYSKNIDNLFMAGRNVSTTHIAIGTVRVQFTIMTLAQAVGTAAHLCLKYGETPRGIYERHIRELQQLLIKNDQYIPGHKNEDEGDPCLTAKATASSVSTTEIFKPDVGVEGDLVPLDRPRSTEVHIGWRDGVLVEKIDGVYLKLHSSNPEPTTVRITGKMRRRADRVAEVEAVVPPMCESWVYFPLEINFTHGRAANYLTIRFEKAFEGISWRRIERLSNYESVSELVGENQWARTSSSCYAIRFTDPTDIPAHCGPEAVINGHSRILSGEIYEWVSDPEQALPQWLELEFAKPADINWVSLVFDTDMTNPGTTRDHKFPIIPLCVKDYAVEVFAEGAWIKVADITENYMRKRNHSFETVKAEKLRVTVFKTWGDKSARITEVRASLEE